ncbi:hypothetical protein EC960932_4981, partial [Escherichia coli 96.0932]
MASSGK